MTVAAVTMVRDEADIIATTLANIVAQVDFVIVYDNGSADGTREAIATVDGDVTVLADVEPGYFQSVKMTRLAHLAGERGATWVVPFDADEVWVGNDGPLRVVLECQVPSTRAAVAAAIYDHMVTGEDQGEGPVQRMAWRRAAPLPLCKVAARYHPHLIIDQGNHGARWGDTELGYVEGLVTVHHYPYRTPEQFIRKVRNGARAYADTGDALAPTTGLHWRQWGTWTDDALLELFNTWHRREDPTEAVMVDEEYLPELVFDPAPLAG